MAAQYESITLFEMDTVLTARGFTRKDLPYSLEYAYDKPVTHEDKAFIVRVFTSVDVRTNVSREVGSDAIRTVVLTPDARNVVSKEKIVHRSTGWQHRLNARLDNWLEDIHWCPQCGNVLVKRKSKYSNKGSKPYFYGCSTYPKCGYIEPTK